MAKLRAPRKQDIDGGYAWVVLFAVGLCTFLEFGNFKTFGIYFVTFLEEFQATASMTSLISATYSIAYSLIALPVEAILLERFSCRQIIMFGGCSLALALLLSSFAQQIEMLIFTHGLLLAIGSVCLHGPSLIILGKYFENRRGMSNSIAMSFGSIGGLLQPIIFIYFMNVYGLRGALLMQAAILFHSVPAGALSRPIVMNERYEMETIQNKQPFEVEDISQRSPVTNLLIEERSNENQGARDHHGDVSSKKEGEDTSYDDHEQHNLKMKTGNVLDQLNHTSYTSLHTLTSGDFKDETVKKSRGMSKEGVCKMFDLNILRNRLVLLFSLVYGLASVTCVLAQLFIPALARERGVSEDLIGYVAASIGASELMGRILLAFVADTRYIKKYQILMIALFFDGVILQFSRFSQTFEHILIFTVSYGFFCGAMHNLYTPICIDFVGLQLFHKAIGVLHLSQGILGGTMGYLIGLMRDYVGGYDVGFHVMGGFGLFACLLLFLVPRLRQREGAPQTDVTGL